MLDIWTDLHHAQIYSDMGFTKGYTQSAIVLCQHS